MIPLVLRLQHNNSRLYSGKRGLPELGQFLCLHHQEKLEPNPRQNWIELDLSLLLFSATLRETEETSFNEEDRKCRGALQENRECGSSTNTTELTVGVQCRVQSNCPAPTALARSESVDYLSTKTSYKVNILRSTASGDSAIWWPLCVTFQSARSRSEISHVPRPPRSFVGSLRNEHLAHNEILPVL